MKPVQTVPITVRIPAVAQRKLFEMAKQYGYQPTHFAQLIFDAAFAARVGIERGDEPADRDLDRMCRAVFCLAGQFDAGAIAQATGMPTAIVERVLEAWRCEARAQGLPMAKPAKAATAEPASPGSEPAGAAQKVPDALAARAKPDGTVAISQDELAKACGVTVATVAYHLRKLTMAGVLALARAGSHAGPAVYRILDAKKGAAA